MDQVPENQRSDVAAKAAFCDVLLSRGFSEARIVASPADIIAQKAEETWYFEIKFTRAKHVCFGAATLPEWIAAEQYQERFRFVIAYRRNDVWVFDEYTPEEFMAFSSVPPFKVYFSVPLDKRVARPRPARSRRIYLTKARLRLMSRQFGELRELLE